MNIIEELIGLASEKIIVLKTVGSIIKLETRLAGLSLVPFLITVGLLIFVLFGIWMVTLCLMTYAFVLAFQNVLLAIVATLVVNTGFLIILLYYCLNNLRNMSFEKTRAYLKHREKGQDDKRKKAGDRQNYGPGKKVTVSRE
jgi:hypothetical protein